MKYTILYDLTQGTKEWLQSRIGKVSGTKLAAVMGTPTARKTLTFELIAEQMSPPEEQFTSQAMQRGIDLEPEAADRYTHDRGIELHEVGLIVSSSYHVLSPDRVCFKKKNYIDHAVEIKCLNAVNHCRAMTINKFSEIQKILKDGKKYYWQIVNYFLVIDTLETLDFMFFNPDFHNREDQSVIIRVTRKDLAIDIQKAREALSDFRTEWLTQEQKIFVKSNVKMISGIEISDDKHYNVSEVASMLDVHPQTVRRKVKAGDLKSSRFGRKIMLKGEDILSYMYNK